MSLRAVTAYFVIDSGDTAEDVQAAILDALMKKDVRFTTKPCRHIPKHPVADMGGLKWWPHGDKVDILCRCGTSLYLRDHSIEASGLVHPSVVCTACGFHETLVLEGWEQKQA